MLRRLQLLWRTVRRRREFEAGMDEEIRLHLESRASDLVRCGLAAAEAERRARIEFGAVEAYKEECRQASGLRLLDEALGDLRYGWRGLAHSPGFTLVATLTLALAIGANTSLFAFLRAYIWRPLPVSAPHRNVQLAALGTVALQDNWSYPDFTDLARERQVFEAVYASSSLMSTLRDPTPRTVRIGLVSGNLFGLFHARTVLGRGIGAEDDRVPGRDAVLVLSAHAWRRLFASDPSVVGRVVRLDHAAFTVIGVADSGFTGAEPLAADAWAPLTMAAQLSPRRDILTNRERGWLTVGGLLAPGVSPEEAHARLSGVLASLNARHRPDLAMRDLVLMPWSTVFLINADTRQAVAALLAGFGLVLLVACANLAGLLVARASARQRELAVRLALGATRPRLVRQLLTENLLLALIGALGGLTLTLAANGALQRWLFGFGARFGLSFDPIGPDWQVYVWSVALALVAGVAFGLAPALLSTEAGLSVQVRQESAACAGRPRARRLRGLLMTSEVTACFVLLVAAGLLFRGAQQLARLSHGYDLGHAVEVRLSGPRRGLVRWLEGDPRFASLTEASRAPLSGPPPALSARVEEQAMSLGYTLVDQRYFDTLGLPIRRGQAFSEAEVRGQARVAIVSESTARRLWPGADPIGRTFEVAGGAQGAPVPPGTYQLVGVAGDAVNGRLDEGPDWAQVYLPVVPDDPRNSLVVRVRRDVGAFVADLKSACFELDAGSSCAPLALEDRAFMQRLPVVVVRDIAAGVSLLALALTSIGLAGLVAYAAVQRKREIGVRMALGSPRSRVLGSMLSESARHVASGVAIGLPLCLALSLAASRAAHLAHFETFDALAYCLAPLALAGIALSACYVPARRATRVDPMIALREE